MRARDGRELRDTERAAFAKCMHFAKRCGQASVEDVCKEWEISKSHGYRILNRWRTEESVLSRPRSGRPRALTEEDMKTLESLSEEVNGYFVVFVQMDNARPHVKRKTHLEVAGKRRKRINGKQMPLIKFVLQPANSPDTNLNDLCFFRSLSKLVQEHEREIEHSAANRDKFWNLIVEQYHEFHSRETLERCWDVKTAVNKCILDAKGTNNYKLPHGIKHEEPVSHDISLDLDDTGDPVARTLDYEGLHASLPSSLPR